MASSLKPAEWRRQVLTCTASDEGKNGSCGFYEPFPATVGRNIHENNLYVSFPVDYSFILNLKDDNVQSFYCRKLCLHNRCHMVVLEVQVGPEAQLVPWALGVLPDPSGLVHLPVPGHPENPEAGQKKMSPFCFLWTFSMLVGYKTTFSTNNRTRRSKKTKCSSRTEVQSWKSTNWQR